VGQPVTTVEQPRTTDESVVVSASRPAPAHAVHPAPVASPPADDEGETPVGYHADCRFAARFLI